MKLKFPKTQEEIAEIHNQAYLLLEQRFVKKVRSLEHQLKKANQKIIFLTSYQNMKKILKKVKKQDWKPKPGEIFYMVFIRGGATLEKVIYDPGYFMGAVRVGNCFRTCDEAKAVAIKINAIFKANRK